MKKLVCLSIAFIGLLICPASFINAQGVGVNPSGAPPHPSAILDASATNQGMLIPRLTTAQRDAIVSPAEGLQIYNLDCHNFNYNAGTPSAPNWVAANPPIMPSTPAAGTNTPSTSQITWNWNTVPGATGYKWNTTNNYASATNNGNSTNYTQTGLTCGTSYNLYVWAYSPCGNSTATMLTQSTSSCPCTVGASAGGGVIFYNDGTYCYVSATTNQSTAAEWGCFGGGISGAQGSAIGTGAANTAAIVAGCSTSGIAAALCDNLSLNGYTDWFLPSKDELNQMYAQRSAIGGFNPTNYWSSTEYNINLAWYQNFNTGVQDYYSNIRKYDLQYVRCIRRF